MARSNVDYIDMVIMLASIKMNGLSIHDIRQCIFTTRDLQTNFDFADAQKKLFELVGSFSTVIKEVAINFHNELTLLFKQINYAKEEIVPRNDDKFMNAKKIMFKLMWPVKLPHYDWMYGQITDNKDVFVEDDEKIVVATMSGIVATVYKKLAVVKKHCVKKNLLEKKPVMWFKSYAPNIGTFEKTDCNHMFSYLLDSRLNEFPCMIKSENDSTHPGKYNSLYYFYGEMQIHNRVGKSNDAVKGYYEYFLNGHSTLFHRMFNPSG
jgi:hypothetical protein